jgi:hypothetical protein
MLDPQNKTKSSAWTMVQKTESVPHVLDSNASPCGQDGKAAPESGGEQAIQRSGTLAEGRRRLWVSLWGQ